jgi:hypothetical protein
MSRLLKVTGGVVLGLTMLTPMLHAETSVGTSTVGVSATVLGVNTLTAEPRNVSDDQPAPGVAFGSVSPGGSAWSELADQYLRVAVNDNAASWRLRAYSNNFASPPSTATWGFQYGGLIGNVAGAKAPGAWLTNPNAIPGGPGVGNPADGTSNGWTFLKDFHDVDDPGAAGDSSFAGSDADGYTNIAFGSPSFTRIVRPNIGGGSEALATPTSPFFFYLEADFSASPADSYSGTYVLELINQ